MDNATFTYRFDWDRDYFIDFSMEYQSTLPFITLITFRPLIFLILLKKRDYMTAAIRWAYIINQAQFPAVAMMLHEFNFCFLFRIHDLAPYSGLYCDGPICRMGIRKQLLMAMLACSTIGTVPSFLLLLIRIHQKVIEGTDSQLKLSKRAQTCLFIFFSVLLAVNVPGFYYFGRDCHNATKLVEIPDLAWLSKRGGTIFMFGPPGKAEFFGKELLMLFCSILIIVPFIVVAVFHTLKVMYEQNKTLTSRTQRLQMRLAAVFFLQLIGISGFYVAPLSGMLFHMVIDVSIIPVWMIFVARCTLIIAFTLESTQLSLIFLLKNPIHREIIKKAFIDFFKTFRGDTRLDRIESTIRR